MTRGRALQIALLSSFICALAHAASPWPHTVRELLARFEKDRSGIARHKVVITAFVYEVAEEESGGRHAYDVYLSDTKFRSGSRDFKAPRIACTTEKVPAGLGQGKGVGVKVVAQGIVVDFGGMPVLNPCIVERAK